MDVKDDYVYLELPMGIQVKELTLLFYMHVVKIGLLFAMGIRIKYHEQQWYKKVFYNEDGLLVATFTES